MTDCDWEEGDADGHGDGGGIVVERRPLEHRRQPQHCLISSGDRSRGCSEDRNRAVGDCDEDGRGPGRDRGGRGRGRPPRCPSPSQAGASGGGDLRGPPHSRYQNQHQLQQRRSPTTRRRRQRSRTTGESGEDSGERERAPLVNVGRSSSSSSSGDCRVAGIAMGDDGGGGVGVDDSSGGGGHRLLSPSLDDDDDDDDDDGRGTGSAGGGDLRPLHHNHVDDHANDCEVITGVGGRQQPSHRRRRRGYSPIGEEQHQHQHRGNDTDHDRPDRMRIHELLPLLPVAPPPGGGMMHANGTSPASVPASASFSSPSRSRLRAACVCVAWFSLMGVIFLAFVLVLIERQPFFVKGFSSMDDDELRRVANNASLGALSYVASLVLSLCCLRHHDRIELWWRGSALRVRSWWQRRSMFRRRRWARRWSTTTGAAEDGGVWMYSYHAADPSIRRDGIVSDTGASAGSVNWLGGDEDVPLRRRSVYQNSPVFGDDAQYGTFELWKLRWNGVTVGGKSGMDGMSSDGHNINKTKRR